MWENSKLRFSQLCAYAFRLVKSSREKHFLSFFLHPNIYQTCRFLPLNQFCGCHDTKWALVLLKKVLLSFLPN